MPEPRRTLPVASLALYLLGAVALLVSIGLTPERLLSMIEEQEVSKRTLAHLQFGMLLLGHAGLLALLSAAFVHKGRSVEPPTNSGSGHRTDLFVVSFAILFLELAVIRWIPAYVKLVTYFTNFLLMAAFLGIGLGCLLAGARRNLLRSTPFLLAFVVVAALGIYVSWNLNLISYSLEAPSRTERIYFGGDVKATGARIGNVGMGTIVGGLFVLVTAVFAGLGQKMGRAFDHYGSPLGAYAINIGASAAGVAAFALSSHLALPAFLWFVVAGVLLLWLLRSDPARWLQGALLLVPISLAFFVDRPNELGSYQWSPYYRIQYNHPNIRVNELNHQLMLSQSEASLAYDLPYLLRRDSGGEPFENVLVIGAGSGNDVSHALFHEVDRVVAVEIDPLIQGLGRDHHPDLPYDDERVEVVVDDGRSHLRGSHEKHDLVVYALVDSLALMGGLSSVRLESFLFTTDAFRDVKSHLTEDGVFVLYNSYRENWLLDRLAGMLEEVFGHPPVILLGVDPPLERITPETEERPSLAMFLVGDVDQIQAAFAQGQRYRPGREANGFETSATEGVGVPATVVEGFDRARVPDDNWPFVYLWRPGVPVHNQIGLVLVALFALLTVGGAIGPKRLIRLDRPMFCLGAGFMLLETSSIVRLAVLHGSTWLVNSIVFLVILILILAANVYVLRFLTRPSGSPIRLYALLFAGLTLAWFLPPERFLGGGFWLETVAATFVLLLPIALAGIIFAVRFRDSESPAADLGSNLLGVIAGGILEYTSLVAGYQALVIVAAVLYALSYPRRGH